MKTIACLLIACAAVTAYGQQENHAKATGLDQLWFMKGDWSGKQNFNNQGGGPAMVGTATDRIDVCIEGKYLCEMLSTALNGRKPTDTRHFISYDKGTGKFSAWWFNDTSTHPTVLTGELNGDKLELMSDGSDGGPMLKATYECPMANTLTFQLEMKTGDSWTRLFLSTYTKGGAGK